MNIYADFQIIIAHGAIESLKQIDVFEYIKSNKKIVIKETDHVEFYVITKLEDQKVELWFNDLNFKPTEFIKSGGFIKFIWKPRYNGNYSQIFLNIIGKCKLKLGITHHKHEPIIYDLVDLEITSRKMTFNQLEYMLEYIAPDFGLAISGIISPVSYESKYLSGNASISQQLIIAKSIMDFLRLNLCNYKKNKITRLTQRFKYCRPNENDIIGADEIDWMINHLDSFEPSDDNYLYDIKINNAMYDIGEIRVSSFFESTDVFENKVIHAVLFSIKEFLNKTLLSINQKIENIPKLEQESEYDEFIKFSEVIKKVTSSMLIKWKSKIHGMLESLGSLIYFFENELPVKDFRNIRPVNTMKVQKYKHYLDFFEIADQWFKIGSPDISTVDALINIRTVDELFEFYCLSHLNNALKSINATFEHNIKSKIINKDYDLNMANNIKFSGKYQLGDSLEADLVYQQKITANGRVVLVSQECRERRPDYMLYFNKSDSAISSCYVLDAKFSRESSAMQHRLFDAVIKYFHGFSDPTHKLQIRGLFLLTVSDNKQCQYSSFHSEQYSLTSENPVSPALGLVTFNFDSRDSLLPFIKDLVKFDNKVSV